MRGDKRDEKGKEGRRRRKREVKEIEREKEGKLKEEEGRSNMLLSHVERQGKLGRCLLNLIITVT